MTLVLTMHRGAPGRCCGSQTAKQELRRANVDVNRLKIVSNTLAQPGLGNVYMGVGKMYMRQPLDEVCACDCACAGGSSMCLCVLFLRRCWCWCGCLVLPV